MQEVETCYTEIIWLLDSTLIGYFQLLDIAANCFTSSDYDKPRNRDTTLIRRDTSYGKLLIHAKRDDGD